MKSPASPVSCIQAVAVTQHEFPLSVRGITAWQCRGRAIVSSAFQPACLQGAYIADCKRPCKQKRPRRTVFNRLKSLRDFGAGEGIRTLDPNLGKVVLYP